MCDGNSDVDCRPCGPSGIWLNDLGSVMEITCLLDDSPRRDSGFLVGKYNSAVGNAKDFYELSGRYTMVGSDYIVGFNVAWNNDIRGNSNSSASFTGVYYANDDTIYTHWILCRDTAYQDMWKNSNVGKNVFVRQSINSNNSSKIKISWLMILITSMDKFQN